jgi:hypothetical protein
LSAKENLMATTSILLMESLRQTNNISKCFNMCISNRFWMAVCSRAKYLITITLF